MLKKLRILLISLLVLSIVIIILLSIALKKYYEKKSPKIPTKSSSSLYQSVDLNDARKVHLIAVGDMGREGLAQKGVADSIERRCNELKPDALIFLGDNIYPDGVKSVDDPAWDTDLMQYYQGDCIHDVPIYAVLGNHDYIASAQAQIDYSKKNKQWNMPFRFYELKFGDLLSLTAGDTWYLDYCFDDSNHCSANFILDSLQRNQDMPWRIVASHYPVRTSSTQSSGHSGGIKGRILEYVLCQSSAIPTAYLAGHSHHLEHSISPVCDMDLIVSGAGGGSSLYSVDAERSLPNSFVQSVNGFAEITADANSIQYSFYDSGTNQLYLQTRQAVDYAQD